MVSVDEIDRGNAFDVYKCDMCLLLSQIRRFVFTKCKMIHLHCAKQSSRTHLQISENQKTKNMLFSLIEAVSLFTILTVLYCKLNKWYRRERVTGFAKKIVFVTGTDHGFGNALVTKLDKMGLKVYAGCYTKEGAERVRKSTSERVKTVMIDVTKRETIVAARDFIEKDLGPNEELWGLVNNAGIIKGILFDFCLLDDYEQAMEVNFYGVMTTTEIFLPMIKKSRGRIVIMSSCAARTTFSPDPYSCSKHALEVFCSGLRRSMITFGLHVATIEPGYFRTPLMEAELWKAEMDRTWNNLPVHLKNDYGQEYKDMYMKHILEVNPYMPLTKGNKIEDVMNSIIHGLSSKRPKARYVVGNDAKIAIILNNFLPDWFLNHFTFITRKYAQIPIQNK